jgi:hypothetical protein
VPLLALGEGYTNFPFVRKGDAGGLMADVRPPPAGLERVRSLGCCVRPLARQENRNKLKGWDQATSPQWRIGRNKLHR